MMKYPKEIEVYHEACDEILSWMGDWLHQNEFDQKARHHRPVSSRVVGYTNETILLDPFGGRKDLALMQAMQARGLVEARESQKGGIEYRSASV